RTAQIIRCDDTETDDRVNLNACGKLGARSMVAVPLCGRKRVIGLLEAFSAEPFGFNDSDVDSLELLAELILGALKPEDEERFAESAQAAVAELVGPPIPVLAAPVAAAPVPEVLAPEKLPFQPVVATVPAAVVEPAAPVTAPVLSATPVQIVEETPADETIAEPSTSRQPG